MKYSLVIIIYLVCSIIPLQGTLRSEYEKTIKDTIYTHIKNHEWYQLKYFLQDENVDITPEIRSDARRERDLQMSNYSADGDRKISALYSLAYMIFSSATVLLSAYHKLPTFTQSHMVYTYTAGMLGMFALKHAYDSLTNRRAHQAYEKACAVRWVILDRWGGSPNREYSPTPRSPFTQTAPELPNIKQALK